MINTANSLLFEKDAKDIWKDCLSIIKENVPNITYNTWFLPIKPSEVSGTTLKVFVPNNFFIEWIEQHFNTLIKNTVSQVLGENGKLIYVILEETENVVETENNFPVEKKKTNITIPLLPKKDFDSCLITKYTFDNFIKGEGNQLARAAAYAVGDNPGQTSFNPLFIYGGVGLGKTHLIHAIGNKVLERAPEKRVIYLSSDAFTVEFVEAIQSNTVNNFSNFYKSMDALIIDDIQFLVGKEKTQDLFFHIFNTLHQSGKQIILSSDRPPKELKGLSDRLVSRFLWGLQTDIQPPDLETRIAILKNKSESYGIKLSRETLEYIAYNITSNIRELEGCLVKLLANASLTSRDLDFDLVKKTVREVSTNKQVNISIELITKIVCEYFEIEENKLREKNRRKEIVLARQIAMFLSKQLTKSSLKTIGLHFGGRDHSTVIHAHTTIEEAAKTDFKIQETLSSIKNTIELSVT
ncbi:MAG: chromosomal replication initiator protein DnaA [Ignavibacteria bacterium]|nr:MAG: chromosomal replication initiator protein DnaA [Ignavibacteria bacterium]KAF0159090.1 MAG: chromosomal replication initiator protein DnaA [Ignavibacteria bacterium]